MMDVSYSQAQWSNFTARTWPEIEARLSGVMKSNILSPAQAFKKVSCPGKEVANK